MTLAKIYAKILISFVRLCEQNILLLPTKNLRSKQKTQQKLNNSYISGIRSIPAKNKTKNKMPQNQMPELLTLKEACELLRVHANTLRNWERDGKLQTIRIGARRDRRFTKASLEQFFQTSNQVIAA